MPLVTQVRSYELITPLFGGGVEPGETDPVTIIRGPAIRGQLRFWWRACRGGRFNGDLAAMKEAEDKLWGAASTEKKPMPSQVEIVISIEQSGEDEHPFEVVAGSMEGRKGKPKPKPKANEIVAPAYAAFPLQPSEKEMRAGGIGMQTKTVRTKVRFTLKITYPEKRREEVEAALWAWETFGGIGARTRRGFGALKLVSVDGRPVTPPRADEVEAKIREGLQKYVVSGTWPAGVPHVSLNPRMKVTDRHAAPKAAWEYLIKRLRDFRQSRPGASTKQPGRSRWPEPDEIRRLTDCRCDRHAKPLSTVRKFPRAAFGLPIVFHFKDEKIGDPYDTTLQGRDYERLASPLILRPLAYADGAVGLAVVLEGTGVAVLPDGLILRKKEEADISWPVEATIEAHEAQKIPLLDGIPDVLQAFFKEL
ncbi:type III-B CRISPR module RAMP protein Cmr1 [Desulforudis sp. DRI-14]|uniref:type III-B CRISPR module RAMP protein Cmr1 n=1 Tax=Desulforudis sp. DRI-14 TaxID=3459793 RepID=UPI004041F6BB